MSIYKIACAMKEKNEIDRDRLKLEREIFEENKRINRESLDISNKTNDLNLELVEAVKVLNKRMEDLSKNDSVLYGELIDISSQLAKITKLQE